MPWAPFQLTLTLAEPGCAKVNVYGPAPEPLMPVAGVPSQVLLDPDDKLLMSVVR